MGTAPDSPGQEGEDHPGRSQTVSVQGRGERRALPRRAGLMYIDLVHCINCQVRQNNINSVKPTITISKQSHLS